jgi:mRNA interferase MazF
MKRYDVRWAALDPAKGAEMAKTRPVVIVSRDELNDHLDTVTVCPLTSQLHPSWRTRLGVRVNQRGAEIAVDQIRAMSKARLGKKIAALSSAEAAALRRVTALPLRLHNQGRINPRTRARRHKTRHGGHNH